MNDLGFALLIMMAATPAAAEPPAEHPDIATASPVVLAMQIIERRIIIRIPVRRPLRRPPGRTPMPRPNIRLRERPADECQPVRQIARARFTRPGVVDFMMRDRRVIRARLDSECVNLGYYSAFYLVPGEDGQVCVNRDLVQSRAGGQCAISGFHTLQAGPAN